MNDFTDRVERFSLGEHAYGCECSGCTIATSSALDIAHAERDQARDELAAYLAKGDGVTQAQLTRALRVLRRLLIIAEPLRHAYSANSLLVSNALDEAQALIAEVE